LWLWAEPILALFDASALAPVAWLLPVAQLAGGVMLAFTGLAVRQRDYASMASSRVGQNATMVGAQIAAGAAGAGPAGLLCGDVLGRAAGGIALAVRGLRGLRHTLMTTTRHRLRAAASRYRRFPLIGVWPSLLNALGLQVPMLLVIALYGAEVGGLFAFGQRLIGAPVALLVISVGDVFFGEASRRAREEPATLRGLARSTFRQLVRVALPLAVVAVPASLLVGPMFGEQWQEAGVYLAILVPMYTVQVVTSPFGGMLAVVERQDLWLVRELIRVGLISLAVVAAAALDLDAVWAVAALSLAGCVAYGCYGALSWYGLRSFERRLAARSS
jgi:O-antigen/teichoic acid export membrane protein